MFVQVLRGQARDRTRLRRQWETWDRNVKPTATAYLGSTAGITDDGEFIAMVRFESESAARVDQARDAQTRWWNETRPYLRDELVFHDCTDTDIWAGGGSDTAGFVQIRQGVSNNPARLRDLYLHDQRDMAPLRPEVIGGLFACHGRGGFTISAYFTSEREARRGEQVGEFQSFFEDISAVMQELDYLDLKDPWLSSR